jgi:hypothetical protein
MKISSQDFRPPKDFEIEEVKTSPEDQEKTVLEAGNVEEWQHLELKEKVKARLYITSLVISLWMICTIAGLIRWTSAGDASLLISSPILLIGPLHEILRFYYR